MDGLGDVGLEVLFFGKGHVYDIVAEGFVLAGEFDLSAGVPFVFYDDPVTFELQVTDFPGLASAVEVLVFEVVVTIGVGPLGEADGGGGQEPIA
jgi:hypothetical protein